MHVAIPNGSAFLTELALSSSSVEMSSPTTRAPRRASFSTETTLPAGEIENSQPLKIGQQLEKSRGCRIAQLIPDHAGVEGRDLIVARHARHLSENTPGLERSTNSS